MKKSLTISVLIIFFIFDFIISGPVNAKSNQVPGKKALSFKSKAIKPCKAAPIAQVVNNSGISIFKVRVGSVEFSRHLSSCFYGCSTPFKRVRSGRNSVQIKFSRTAPWKSIGSLGSFEVCKKYALNITKRGNRFCAALAQRFQTDSTYNNDRTKKVITETCAAPMKKNIHKTKAGMSTPGKNRKKTKPELVQRGKKVYLKFPVKVKRLIVRSSENKILQTFNSGSQFDVTKSIKENKGKDLKLTYFPAKSAYYKQGKKPGNIIPFEGEGISLPMSTIMYCRSTFSASSLHDLDRNEPYNNSIDGAVTGVTGILTGNVGGDDPADFFRVNLNRSGYGKYIKITRRSGNVNLHLYDPAKHYLDWNRDSIWIAITAGSSFYVKVESVSGGSTEYELRLESTNVTDDMEPNDTFSQARVSGAAGKKVLCNLITDTGSYTGLKDYYKFNLTSEKLIRINVGNADLAAGRTVSISLYDSNNTLHYTAEGNSNSAFLEYDLRGMYSASWPPFPAGEWKILVTCHTETNAAAYGTGNGPACYTDAAGYSLHLELID